MWLNCSERSRGETSRASATSPGGLAWGDIIIGGWSSKVWTTTFPTLQGNQPPGLPMPVPVASHSRRAHPQPRLHPREPLASNWAEASPPLVGADKIPLRARVGWPRRPSRVERHPLPTRVIDQPPQVRTSPLGLQKALPTAPRVEEGQVMVPVWIGTRCTCVRPRGG